MSAPPATHAASVSASKATASTPATPARRGPGRPKGSKNKVFGGTLSGGRVIKRGRGRPRGGAVSPSAKVEWTAAASGEHADMGNVTDNSTGWVSDGTEEVQGEVDAPTLPVVEGAPGVAAGPAHQIAEREVQTLRRAHQRRAPATHGVSLGSSRFNLAAAPRRALPGARGLGIARGQPQPQPRVPTGIDRLPAAAVPPAPKAGATRLDFARQLQVHRQLLSQILVLDQDILDDRARLLREFHPYLRLTEVQIRQKYLLELHVRSLCAQRSLLVQRAAAVCAALRKAASAGATPGRRQRGGTVV